MTLNWTCSTDDSDALAPDGEVMFAVDEDDDGGKLAIIADITQDDAWISVPLGVAQPLSQRR
ncbi:DUF7556 family protein [Haladaptatus sp.]|uniref:DUF7556 family protein n=1 Tax=Haladaptatus sp. TaxID=1973141 RepID=UPI003C48CDDA